MNRLIIAAVIGVSGDGWGSVPCTQGTVGHTTTGCESESVIELAAIHHENLDLRSKNWVMNFLRCRCYLYDSWIGGKWLNRPRHPQLSLVSASVPRKQVNSQHTRAQRIAGQHYRPADTELCLTWIKIVISRLHLTKNWNTALHFWDLIWLPLAWLGLCKDNEYTHARHRRMDTGNQVLYRPPAFDDASNGFAPRVDH